MVLHLVDGHQLACVGRHRPQLLLIPGSELCCFILMSHSLPIDAKQQQQQQQPDVELRVAAITGQSQHGNLELAFCPKG